MTENATELSPAAKRTAALLKFDEALGASTDAMITELTKWQVNLKNILTEAVEGGVEETVLMALVANAANRATKATQSFEELGL